MYSYNRICITSSAVAALYSFSNAEHSQPMCREVLLSQTEADIWYPLSLLLLLSPKFGVLRGVSTNAERAAITTVALLCVRAGASQREEASQRAEWLSARENLYALVDELDRRNCKTQRQRRRVTKSKWALRTAADIACVALEGYGSASITGALMNCGTLNTFYGVDFWETIPTEVLALLQQGAAQA